MKFVDVWVITWRFFDGSDSGVVRVHEGEAGANHDLQMLRDHANGIRRYDLQLVHMVKE